MNAPQYCFYTPATNPPPIDECPGSIDPTELWSIDESIAAAYAEESTND